MIKNAVIWWNKSLFHALCRYVFVYSNTTKGFCLYSVIRREFTDSLRGLHFMNFQSFFRCFHLSGEIPFVFFMFSILFLFLFYFPRDSFFININILKHVFSLCDWPLKVLAPNDPLPDNTKNLQSYCPLCMKWLLSLLLWNHKR